MLYYIQVKKTFELKNFSVLLQRLLLAAGAAPAAAAAARAAAAAALLHPSPLLQHQSARRAGPGALMRRAGPGALML